MSRVLLDALVMTDYGQLEVLWGEDAFAGDFDPFFAGRVNGLAGASSGTGLYLSLGRRSGSSPVGMVLPDEAPGSPGSEWEDVVEVSVTISPGSEVGWCTCRQLAVVDHDAGVTGIVTVTDVIRRVLTGSTHDSYVLH